MQFERELRTPIGVVTLRQTDDKISELAFGGRDGRQDETPLLLQAEKELEEYFAGRRSHFSVPLSMHGTAFQLQVWQALMQIPYGAAVSYGELARKLGKPKACRAVGMANHANPLPIFVPCHRVVGADGKLTGYRGGLEIKRFLLNLEEKHAEV